MWRRTFLSLAILCIICLLPLATAETEVQWTGNEADSAEGSSGPLPLSMKQRQQLLQLEEVIRQSPNPEATLTQAAEANGMSPQELASMLQRNRSDLEQGVASAGGRGRGMSIGGLVGKLVTTLAALIAKFASQNPRAFAVVATTILLLLFVAVSAPRTGLELSSQRGLLSKGPTTVFKPPSKFLEKRLASPKWQQRDETSSNIAPSAWRELILDQDGTEWHSISRKSDLSKAATAQITIPIAESFLDEGNDDEEESEYAMDLCFNHAVDVLASRALTEYAPGDSVRIHTLQKDESRKRFVALVVKKLGDFGRYGIIPMQVTSKKESDTEASLTLSALKVAHFSGQIHVSVEKRKKKKGVKKSIVIAVHLAVPKKASKLNKKASLKIVDSLAISLSTSVKTRTRQSLARRAQSSSFSGKAKARAEERKSSRHEKEKQLEEMAEDRRRKWQRNNPDAGRYRPSGNMMKGPDGSPSYR